MNPPRIIHNKENLGRHFNLREQLSSQGIEEYTFEPPVYDKSNPAKGVHLAHRAVIEKYYDEPEITVFEDDIVFTSPESWKYYWKLKSELPKDWAVYLGGYYSWNTRKDATDNLYSLRFKFTGLHWYTIRKEFYDKFLSLDETKHVDRELAKTGIGIYAPKLTPSRQMDSRFEEEAYSERELLRGGKRKANYVKFGNRHDYLK